MITQGMNSYCNYDNYCCHDNRSKGLVDTLAILAGDGPIVNMEDKRQEVVDCDVVVYVVMMIVGYCSNGKQSKKHGCLLS